MSIFSPYNPRASGHFQKKSPCKNEDTNFGVIGCVKIQKCATLKKKN